MLDLLIEFWRIRALVAAVFLSDLRDGPYSADPIFELGEIGAIAGHDAEVVLLDDGVEEFLGLVGRHAPVGAEDEQYSDTIGLDFRDLGQRQDGLIGDLAPRFEHRFQSSLQFGVDLRLRRTLGVDLDLLAKVLVALEDEGVVLTAVQIPAVGAQLLEGVVELGRRPVRSDEVLDDLRPAQALHGAARLRQRRHQQQAGDLGRGVATHLFVDDLGMAAFGTRARDVVRYGTGQVVDVGDAFADIRQRQVEVLAANEVDIVCLSIEYRTDHHRRQGHQTARLPEAFVVFE